jgi:hypothetical protein
MKLSRILPIPRTLMALAAASLLLTPLAASAQDKVTVMLRSGEKVSGDLEDLNQNTLFVRASLHDQRKLPIGEVAVIDFVGGASGLPETELSKARGDDHLLVLRSSDMIAGRLVDISGGAGSDRPDEPRLFIFRTTGGEERRVPVAQVGRVYVGRYPGKAGPSLPADAQGVKVAANQDWVATGIYVTAGQQVTFGTQGEVQLSGDANDRATSAGSKSGRRAQRAPMPGVLAGALIGRVGANGAPFGIGDQRTVPMPASGELFLAVNDDDRNDNQGAFAVTVTPAPVSVPQRRPR